MKQVTRERLEKANQKIQDTLLSRTEWLRNITHYLATIGLRSVMAESFEKEPDFGLLPEKLGLELDYNGIPKREEDCQKVLDELFRLSDHYHKKFDKIYEIQKKAVISGLNKNRINLAGKIFEVYDDFEDGFPLIPQDLLILRKSKASVISLFLDHVKYHNLKIWVLYDDRNEWEEVDSNRIYELMPLFDWAFVYDFEEEDDTERLLRFGKGVNTHSNQQGVQFAAKSTVPSL